MPVTRGHSPGPPKSPRSILRNPLIASSRTKSGSESGLDKRRGSLTEIGQQAPQTRSRHSVADLSTLIRAGYACDPERASWSGSRIWSSGSLLSASTGEADSGEYEEIDSGVGDDPWCQYKTLIQKKKKLILDEHTSWCNAILGQRQCQPIRDLCRSIGDGLTLVNLVEILTNDQVAGITSNPVVTSEKVDNLQNTLRHLELHDVDTHGIHGNDLVDGNLKSTLILMNNLRRRYETYQAHPPRSSSGDRDVSAGQPQDSPGPPGQSRPNSNTVRFAGETAPTPPPRSTTPVPTRSGTSPALRHRSYSPGPAQRARTPEPGPRSQTPNPDVIPGVVPDERAPSRPPPPQEAFTSATEVNQPSEHGVRDIQTTPRPSSRPHSAKPSGSRPAVQYQQSQVNGYPHHNAPMPTHHGEPGPHHNAPPPPHHGAPGPHHNAPMPQQGTSYGGGPSTIAPPAVTHAWSHETHNVPPTAGQHIQDSTQSQPSNVPYGQSRGQQHGQSRDTRTSQGRGVPPSLRSHGVVNGAYEYDDGEFIVPPNARDGQEPAMDISKTSYVPSHPSQRPQNGQGQPPNRPRTPQGNHPPSNRPHTPLASHSQPNGPHTPQANRHMPNIPHTPQASHSGHYPNQPSQPAAQIPPNYHPPPQYSRPNSQGNMEHEPPQARDTQSNTALGSHPPPPRNVPTNHGPMENGKPTNDPSRNVQSNTSMHANHTAHMHNVQSVPSNPVQQRISSQSQSQGHSSRTNQRTAEHPHATSNPRPTRGGTRPSHMSSPQMSSPQMSSQQMSNQQISSPHQSHHIPTSVTVTMVNTTPAPANGRASPQGQSSTPASQSPNHDKTSPPSRWSQQNYVNIDSLGNHIKEGRQTPSLMPQDVVHKTNSPHDNEFVDGQLPPSSVYPVSVMAYDKMKMETPPTGVRLEQSPYMGTRLNQSPHGKKRTEESPRGHVHSPGSHRVKSSPRGGDPQKPDEDIYSVVKKRTPGHTEPWSQNNQAKSDLPSHPQDMEMYNMTRRPLSRSGLIPDADQWDSDDSSVTPPLPALSPSNTPPMTPPGASPKIPTARTYRTPRGLEVNSKPMSGKRKGRRSGSSARSYEAGWRRSSPGKAAYRSPVRRIPTASTNDFDSVDSTTVMSDAEDWEDTMTNTEMQKIRQQMEGLEAMYSEVLKQIGMDKEYLPGSRHSISSMSSVSRTGNRRTRNTQGYSTHRTTRDIRTMNKRFSRLEAHVVTLARSVAHLSSEMRTQNGLYQELEDVKKDLKQMKKERHHQHHNTPGGATGHGLLPDGRSGVTPDGRPATEFDKFRGWIPSISHPKRVRKLAKFFGEDRMLHYFLEKLGYQKYIKNFRTEEITILELPYMNEDRLEKLGIPMGPRQRILQEAQMCFRQENFNIYIV